MKFVILVIVVAAIVAGGYLVISSKNPAPVIAPTGSPTGEYQMAPEVVASPDPAIVASLKQGGSSFADPKGIYGFLYPNDYKQDSQNNGQYIRIYKIGKTQKGQTEMYDGVNMNFEGIALGDQSLEAWVDAHIKSSTADGTSTVTKPKAKVTINGYPGFSYTMRGLGESEYLALQNADSQFAVSVIYMVADPENVGYQKEVDAILSTLELLK